MIIWYNKSCKAPPLSGLRQPMAATQRWAGVDVCQHHCPSTVWRRANRWAGSQSVPAAVRRDKSLDRILTVIRQDQPGW